MFTGLIETMGTIVGVRSGGRSVEISVKPDMADFGDGVGIGGSVAIDGVCLTLEKRGSDGAMMFTAVAETLKRTTFDRVSAGRRVNLERAMRADGRLDGHIVLGHVDAVGKIVADEKVGVSLVRTIQVPEELSMFMAEKGSVAIDGISLTIASAGVNTISLSLIPATIAKTTMSTKKIGDPVNIECDVLARYIYRMMTAAASSTNTGSVIGSGRRGGNLPPAPDGNETLIGKMERLGF